MNLSFFYNISDNIQVIISDIFMDNLNFVIFELYTNEFNFKGLIPFFMYICVYKC